MTEVSKTDQLGCSLHALATAIETLDTKFANETGSIKLDTLEKILEAAALVASTLKQVYKCQGKDFEVSLGSTTAGKTVATILKLLIELAGDEPKNPA